MTCDLQRLAAFVAGELDPGERAELEAHLDGCALCLETLALHAGAVDPRAELLGRGATLGRYLVVHLLGRGSMGVVYVAYDPELDRKVALKVVDPQVALGLSLAESKARLAREARALARLSHPNVVAVFDVGELDDRLFIAMERVDGVSLGEWLRAEPRTVVEVLDVFYQAGRGLAAAHAANLVHRDFKPANVLVGRDGRVRVADFGLARIEAAVAEHAVDHLHPGVVASALVGTPAYMAPEQRTGIADARSDQYAFCVALAEALGGERPDELGALRGRPVPPWIARVLRRGLARDPAARHESMDALLAALEKDPVVRRRLWAAAIVALLLVVGADVFGRAALARRSALCGGAAQQTSEGWSAARRRAVEARLRGLKAPYAEASATTALRLVDGWTARWQAMFRDACEATQVRHEQAQAVLDLRMACLTDELRDLSATTQVLSTLDAAGAERAVSIASALPPLAACADVAGLRGREPRPTDPAAREKVDRLEARLADVRSQQRAGRARAALEVAAPLVEDARAAAYRPLLAEALQVKGDLEQVLGDNAAAERSLFESSVVAERGRDDRETTLARAGLAAVLSSVGRRDEALRFVELASAALHRMGGDPLVEAIVEDTSGEVLQSMGRFAEAHVAQEHVLALREQALGPDDRETAAALVNLGNLDEELQQTEKALAMYRRAAPIIERSVGAEHPDMALVLSNIGSSLRSLERYGEAREYLERALALDVRLLGPDDPQVAQAHAQLGKLLRQLGQLDGALREDREALRAAEKSLGPENPWVGWPLTEMGMTELKLHQPAEAVVALERALALPARKRSQKPEVKWPLAQALWESQGKKARVRVEGLIADVLSAYDPKIPREREHIDEIDAWRRAHLGGS